MAKKRLRLDVKAPHTEDLTLEERAYYQEIWGFDPVTDRKTSPPLPPFEDAQEAPEDGEESEEYEERTAKVAYYYEAPVPLNYDPELEAAGVVLIARVVVHNNGTSHNRILFKRGERTVEVSCVHTAVLTAPAPEALGLPEEELEALAASTEGHPAVLPPWEHFAALKSFVAGLASLGLMEGLALVNSQLAWTLMGAFWEVTHGLMIPNGDEYFTRLLLRVPEGWLLEELKIHDDGTDHYELIRGPLQRLFQNPSLLKSLEPADQAKLLSLFHTLRNHVIGEPGPGHWENLRTEDGTFHPHETEESFFVFYSPFLLIAYLTPETISTLNARAIGDFLGDLHGWGETHKWDEELAPIDRLLRDREAQFPPDVRRG